MKKTKLKFAAAVAALAMTFAFVTSCGNASDVVDEIVNGSGDDSSTTDTGDKDGAAGEEKAGTEEGSEEKTDETAVKTKYTNSAWVKTGITAAYDGVYIDWENIGLDENFVFSDYNYMKVNVTYSKDGEEVTTAWNTGFCHLSDGTNNVLTISNINNGVSSTYNSAWFPIGALSEPPAKIMVQNAKDNVDTITVNYIEFVKIDAASVPCLPQLDGDNGVIAKGATGKTVVFGVEYAEGAKAYDGIGAVQLGDTPYTWSSVTFNAGADVTAGTIYEIEKSYDDLKSVYDDGYTGLAFKESSPLQYIYIK